MVYRIVSLPGRDFGNRYIDLFYEALKPYDIELVGQLEFDQVWLTKNMDRFDAIHLHWPQVLWRNRTLPVIDRVARSDIPGTWQLSRHIEKYFNHWVRKKNIEWFEGVLGFLRASGKKVIWTWHNVEPHENKDAFDVIGQQILANYTDLIIFHSEDARSQCQKKYNLLCNTVIMAHGNYKGVYPIPHDRASTMSALGLNPELPVIGMLGNIRNYKGIDIAIEACKLLGDSVQFLCAGNPHQTVDWELISNKASNLKHCVIEARYISDQEFSDYSHASDILLLPYRKVTGSGALLAALTMKRGVVASDLPYFRDILERIPNAGMLSPLNDPHQLKLTIEKFLEVDPDLRSKAAALLASEYDWDRVVAPIIPTLKGSLGL